MKICERFREGRCCLTSHNFDREAKATVFFIVNDVLHGRCDKHRYSGPHPSGPIGPDFFDYISRLGDLA